MSSAVAARPERRLPIRMLGELQVGSPAAPLALPASRKTRALLAYLAVTAKLHRRAELCTLFWEDAADPRAGLRWSLTQLRQALGDAHRDLIRADRETVGLRSEHIDTDLAQLAPWSASPRGRAAGMGEVASETLAGLLTLFRGEFLEGLDLPACYAYHEWCMAERDAAGARREQILIALIGHEPGPAHAATRARARAGGAQPAERAGPRRAGPGPGRARAARRRAGPARPVLPHLRVRTRPEVAGRARCGAGRGRLPPRPGTPADPGTAAPIDAPFAGPITARLVGRERRAGTTGRQHRPAAKRPSLRRAAGQRRSRHRQVAACSTSWRVRSRRPAGLPCVAAPSRPSGCDRSGSGSTRCAGLGEDGLPPPLRAAMQPLRPVGASGAASGDRERLFDAVCDLLSLRAQEGPVAVLVDDLQWIEDASAALLHYAMRQLSGSAVLFALGARAGELEDNAAAQQLVAALAQERRLRRIALGPLARRGRACPGRRHRGAGDVERIVARAQGHPMMLLELARAAGLADDAAGLIDRILETRLSRLSPAAAELLGWACAFGHSVPLEALIASQGGTPGSLATALSELERHDLLRADGERPLRLQPRPRAGGRLRPDRAAAAPADAQDHRAGAGPRARGVAGERHRGRPPRRPRRPARAGGAGCGRAPASTACGWAPTARRPRSRGAAGGRRRRSPTRLSARGWRWPCCASRCWRARRRRWRGCGRPSRRSRRPSTRRAPAACTTRWRRATTCCRSSTRRPGGSTRHGRRRWTRPRRPSARTAWATRASWPTARAAWSSSGATSAMRGAWSAQALALADAAGVQEIELHWCQGLLQHWDGELGPALPSLDLRDRAGRTRGGPLATGPLPGRRRDDRARTAVARRRAGARRGAGAGQRRTWATAPRGRWRWPWRPSPAAWPASRRRPGRRPRGPALGGRQVAPGRVLNVAAAVEQSRRDGVGGRRLRRRGARGRAGDRRPQRGRRCAGHPWAAGPAAAGGAWGADCVGAAGGARRAGRLQRRAHARRAGRPGPSPSRPATRAQAPGENPPPTTQEEPCNASSSREPSPRPCRTVN